MMKKNYSFSLSKRTVRLYLSDVDNRSARAEELIVLGGESLINNQDQYRQRLMQVITERDDLERENRVLKRKLNNMKTRKRDRAVETVTLDDINDNELAILRQIIKDRETNTTMTIEGMRNRFVTTTNRNITENNFVELLNEIKNNMGD
jgi:hypothetical protein